MNALLVVLGVALSLTYCHAIGEKIYLRDTINNIYYPLSTSNAVIGGPTQTTEPGSIVVNLADFRKSLIQFVENRNNNKMSSAHRVIAPTFDMTSPFKNDGTSSAFYKNQDANMQNHPVSQITQADLGTEGFADPNNPFKDRVYNHPMTQVNAAPAPQANAAPAPHVSGAQVPQVNTGEIDYLSPFRNTGTSSAYFKNVDQNAHNFPMNQVRQEDLGMQGFADPNDPFSGRVYH